MRLSIPGVPSRFLRAVACATLCLNAPPTLAQPPSSAASEQAPSEPTPKVQLIGIDGLRVDAFQAAQTPNLDALAENGIIDVQTSVISDEVRQSDTISGPGWTTFLSGVWADRHGVIDNSFKGRDGHRCRDADPPGHRHRPRLEAGRQCRGVASDNQGHR